MGIWCIHGVKLWQLEKRNDKENKENSGLKIRVLVLKTEIKGIENNLSGHLRMYNG